MPVLEVGDLPLFELELTAGYGGRVKMESGMVFLKPFLTGSIMCR